MLTNTGDSALGISEISRSTAASQPNGIGRQSTVSVNAYLVTKRLLDMLVALIGLIILAPVYAIIAIAIKLDSPGPVIFAQKRVCGNLSPHESHPEQHVFSFFKFRSMHVNCDSDAHRNYVKQYMQGNHKTNNGSQAKPVYKMKSDPRITRIGRFLRRTSLDELPQLFNVLIGDMSLVGPRPALPYEVEQYDAHHRQRLIPQAGLTGLWQVSGRTCLAFEEMIDLDVEYSHSQSLALDIKILLKTLPAVLSADGAW